MSDNPKLPKGGSGTAPPKGAVTTRLELTVMAKIDRLLLSLDDEERERVLLWAVAIHGAKPRQPCLDDLR